MSAISVLMSVYNEPLDWIQLAIDSILNQTFTDFEFIIINDKPDRLDLKELLERNAAKDSRIRIHTNPENIGLTKSLNVGLKLCTGKYIARMDADDISLPTRFAKQVAYMDEYPDVIVCGCNVRFIGKKSIFLYSCLFEEDIDIRGQMLTNSGLAHPTVMIRRNTLVQNNIQYDESFLSAQDYKLWAQLSEFGKFHNLPQKMLLYRISDQQITKVKSDSQTQNRERVKLDFHKLYQEGRLLGPNTFTNKSNQKKLDSYFLRSRVYESLSISKAVKFIFSNRTKSSSKEIFFLFSYACYNTIFKHK